MITFFTLLTLAYSVVFACNVTLCQHDHKPGKCCTKEPGSYDIGSLKGSCPGNNEVSLVEINGRCEIELFESSGYQGKSYTLNGPGKWSYKTSKFKNDAVSSFKISRRAVTLSDDALVKGIEDTLDECTDIVEAVGDFLHLLEARDDSFRRDEKDDSLAVGVTKKMKTCASIIEAVDKFRENNFFPWKGGHIELRWSEVGFINKALKQVSKKIGETLFVASKDGQASSNFHSACDGKGPTVVIVLTTAGNVFGGYAASSWTSSGSYTSASTSFLFRLRPSMMRYTIKKGRENYSMYRNSGYGPTFGGGFDLYIVNNALSSTSSYTNGGHSYEFQGYPNYQLNDGSKNFKVKDYVVMKAIAI